MLSSLQITVDDPVEGGQVEVFNLLSAEGIQWLFTSAVDNFLDFAPLGVVLVTMLGIGLAEQTGLIGALLRGFILAVPKSLVTMGIVFAGVSAGSSANLLLSGVDVMLGELTIEAAATVDPEYAEGMNLAMNYWFIIASTFLLTIVGTLVSQFIVEPRLGPWEGKGALSAEDQETITLSGQEKKGLLWAGISMIITAALLALLIVPPNGVLRGEDGGVIQSPFMDSLVIIIVIVFAVPGVVYGIVTRSVRNDTDAVDHMSKTLAGMAVFIVLAFAAGQFIAYFEESNLGVMVSVAGAEFLESINLTGIPLLLLFMLFVGIINLFVGSASAKWAMLAPILVPIMMYLGFSPEFTQAAYRVSDSATSILSPLMTYFALIIAVAQRYDKKIGIGSLISVMLPYSIAFWVSWTLMIMGWYWLDLPLGPGSPVHY